MSLRRVLLAVVVFAIFVASGWTYVHRETATAQRLPPHAPERQLADLQLGAAAMALEQLHRMTATYEEADLHAIRRLRVARATESSYCVQVVEGDGYLFHLEGPGGRVADGACPH